MPTYQIHDLNGRQWDFGPDRALKIAAGSLKGFDGAEFSLNTLQGAGQRGVTVVGTDFKPGMISMSVVVQPYQAGVYGSAAVDAVRLWRDGLGEGEVERDGNQLRLYVVDSRRWQAIRLVTKGQMNWERVAASQMCKDDLVFQSDESDWRTDPNTYTFTAGEFASATVSNEGTVDSWPWFKLTGPIASPTLGIAGEAVNLPPLTGGQSLTIETDPNWYSVTNQDGLDVTYDLYTLAAGGDDRWRKQALTRATDIPVTATGTGTSGATKLEVVIPQIYRSAL